MSSLSKLIDKLVSFQSEESREMLTTHFQGSIFLCIANAGAMSSVAGTPWPSPQSLVIFLVALLSTVALCLFLLAMCAGVDDYKTRSTALASFSIFMMSATILCALLSAYFPAQG